jgi:hypothetical protein
VFIAVISIASVCAVDLTKENDFDGKFKMNCTENTNFTVSDRYSPEYVSNQSWVNDNETMYVCYYDVGMDNLIPIINSLTSKAILLKENRFEINPQYDC